MRNEEGTLGGLVVYGTAEEWTRFATGLEDLYSELKHDVLPAAANPTAGGVIVNLKEALAIMAIMEDEELTRSLVQIILSARPTQRHHESAEG